MIDPKILTFLTLARIGNYTKTAEVLNLTQPAISQHIKSLESKLNITLFDRNTKKVILTKEAHMFYKYAEKLYYCNEDLKHLFHKDNYISNTFYIGATHTIAEDIVPDILETYHAKHPNIAFSIKIQAINQLMDELNRKEICLALVEGPLDKKKYNHVHLKDDHLFVISAKENVLSNTGKVTLEDIVRQPLIVREPESGSRIVFENAILNKGYSPADFNNIVEVNSVRFIKKLVMKNYGIGIMSFERIRHEIEHDMINYYELEGILLDREFNIIYLPDSGYSDFIKEFIEISKTVDIHTPKELPTKPW